MCAAMAVVLVLLAIAGCNMFRKVDTAAVENAAFIFALLSARVFYYVALWGFGEWRGFSKGAQLHSSVPLLFRPEIIWLVAFLSFFYFRRMYVAALVDVLELKPKDTDSPASIEGNLSIPEFPDKSPPIELQ
jgi:hypothetical protein